MPGARPNLGDHLDIGRVIHGQDDPVIDLGYRYRTVVTGVALAEHGLHTRIDRPVVEIDEGDPQLNAECFLELRLGDEPELDQSVAKRTVGLPLRREGGLELSWRDGLRLDQHVPKQMRPLILAQERVEFVGRDELLIQEYLTEQRARFHLSLEGQHVLELRLVDQSFLDQQPTEERMMPRTGPVGR
jgi:hypothetical protein